MAGEAFGGDRDVRHRHLPRADELVARGQTADRTVADGDEEGLAGDRRHAQHTICDVLQVVAGDIHRWRIRGTTRHRAMHLRWLAEQHVHRHVDRLRPEVRIFDRELTVRRRFAEHRVRAAFALAQRAELIDPLRRDCEHIALLRFVAPQFGRAHARFFTRNGAQIEPCTVAGAVRQFGQRVRQTTRADVVHGEDGVVVAHLPAAVDHLLCAPLDFRVAALHRREVEVGRVGAGRHARRRATAQTDQHGRATQHDQLGTCREFDLEGVAGADVADAAGDHDGLVIAAHLAHEGQFEGAEITGEVRPAEFVVESGRAQRAIDHDLQRGRDAFRLAVQRTVDALPRLFEPRNVQV